MGVLPQTCSRAHAQSCPHAPLPQRLWVEKGFNLEGSLQVSNVVTK